MRPRAAITGTGFGVPERVMSNEAWAEFVETSDEWIRERTGIKERRILRPDEDPMELAVAAARQALAAAGKTVDEVDLLLVTASVPYELVSNTGAHLKERLGMSSPIEKREISAACAGSIQCLETADEVITLGKFKCVLLVALEALSRSINWRDRNTCVLFGDAAGAVVLEPTTDLDRGILANTMRCASEYVDKVTVRAGGTRTPITEANLGRAEQYIEMAGRDIFVQASRRLPAVTRETLAKAWLEPEDLDWFIPHQANGRIIEQVGKKLGLPRERVVVNIERYGNTSSASILLALAETQHDPAMAERYPIKRGELIAFAAIGAGLDYGAVVLRW